MSELNRAIRAARPIEDIVRLLDDEKQVNAEGPDGKTPLQVALRLSATTQLPQNLRRLPPKEFYRVYVIPLLHQLLDHGASASHFTSDEFHMLTGLYDPALLEKLLQHGLNVDLQDEDERTLLIASLEEYQRARNDAAKQEIAPILEVLAQHDADVQLAMAKGKTAIHMLFHGPIDPFIMRLAEIFVTDENANIEDDDGQTPIIYYAMRTKALSRKDRVRPAQVLQFLEERGAVLSHTDNKGHNAMWWARQQMNDTLEDLLQEKENQRLRNVEEIIVSSTGNQQQYGFTPNVAKTITGYMSTWSEGGKARKGRKGQKTRGGRKTQKGRKGRKAHTRRK